MSEPPGEVKGRGPGRHPKQAEGGNAGADLRARPQQAQQQPAPDRPALMSALEIHMPPTTNMASTRRPQPCASPGSGNAIMHRRRNRSEEHTSELQSLMRISYAVFCLTKKIKKETIHRKLKRS